LSVTNSVSEHQHDGDRPSPVQAYPWSPSLSCNSESVDHKSWSFGLPHLWIVFSINCCCTLIAWRAGTGKIAIYRLSDGVYPACLLMLSMLNTDGLGELANYFLSNPCSEQ